MRKTCLICAHYHPTDKSREIGVCFENGDLPIVQRYRFRFETWTCWEENVCGVNKPLLNISRKESGALDKQFERESEGEVRRAYWQVVKQLCNEQIDQRVR